MDSDTKFYLGVTLAVGLLGAGAIAGTRILNSQEQKHTESQEQTEQAYQVIPVHQVKSTDSPLELTISNNGLAFPNGDELRANGWVAAIPCHTEYCPGMVSVGYDSLSDLIVSVRRQLEGRTITGLILNSALNAEQRDEVFGGLGIQTVAFYDGTQL